MSRFRDLEKRYFDLKWEWNPVAASAAGLTQYDGKYGSMTTEHIVAQQVQLRELATALERAAVDNPADEIDRQALLGEIVSTLRVLEVDRLHQRSPDLWVGLILEGIYTLLRDKRTDALGPRLRSIQSVITDARNTITDPVKLFAEAGLQSLYGGIELLEQVKKEVPSHLTQTVQDALEDFTAFEGDLKQWADNGSDKFAIGKAEYEWHLRNNYLLPDDSQDLWNYGVQLMRETQAELKMLSMYLGGTRDWPATAEKLRENHPKADRLVNVFRKQMERAKEFIEERELFSPVNIPLEVIPMPKYLKATTPFAAYDPPQLYLPNKQGTFFVTVPDDGQEHRLKDHCMFEIAITALHEGYPGHHLQFSHAYASPSRTRNLVASDLLCEGWALYCEDMMGEEGFYTKEELFFQKIHLLWRAIRVLLDVGLHTKGVTPEQATKFLAKNIHISTENAADEVNRYCSTPTQPMTYAIGRREILRFREAFGGSLKEFHDELLSYGAMPLSLIRKGMKL